MTLIGRTEPLYVFDSFEGLSDLSEYDLVTDGRQSELQDSLRGGKISFASSLPNTMKNLKDHSFIQYFPGWIPERFSEIENERFSFVHIDVDLYEPTKDSLEFFYPRLIEGGAIQVDDYNFVDWPGASKAFDDYFQKEKPSLCIQLPLGGAFVIK